MNIAPKRQAWTCARCLRRTAKRRNTTLAATAAASSLYNNVHLDKFKNPRSDDKLLRDVFNSRSVWQDFSRRGKETSGLLGNRYLDNNHGYLRYADSCLAKCRGLVQRVLAAETIEEQVKLPQLMDRLSDLLCRVIDLSDFVRSIHQDQELAACANAAYEWMLTYMNELNTTTGLNSQLQRAWDNPEVRKRWTHDEKMVAVILMRDFAKSGIDLPEASRKEFVAISNEIAKVGTDFTNTMSFQNEEVSVKKSELSGVDPRYLQSLSRWTKGSVTVHSTNAKHILASAHDSGVKRRIYCAERSASDSTIHKLEQLLLERAKLAKLTGYQSYADLTLADKMAKTPESVNNFLYSLNANNRGQLQSEIARMLEVKGSNANQIDPWEHNYLINKIMARSPQRSGSQSRLLDAASDYFAVGHVIQGLSSLFNSLYGVRFVPVETKHGETWHEDVRRLNVLTEDNTHIATIYCDLFSRPGKSPNPAHFTLLCSRVISEEEILETLSTSTPQLDSLNQGMPVRKAFDPLTGKTTHHQLPIIALVCDFPDTTSSSSTTPTTLSPTSVTTLFHEMGHAIHSILGQTSMQGISGTRCATDFAELPSVLMEYFATDPSVLSLFARHHTTDDPIPQEIAQALSARKQQKAELTSGWDNQTQILMAILDQVYHSTDPMAALPANNGSGKYDSTAAFHKTWSQHSLIPEPQGTRWQGFFGHLYGYGATYYAYLFDRAIARQVWRAVFRDGSAGGAIDREAGERFKNEVLRHGGGRDPWECLEGLMGKEVGQGVLGSGGKEAMEMVGEWGVGAGSEGAM